MKIPTLLPGKFITQMRTRRGGPGAHLHGVEKKNEEENVRYKERKRRGVERRLPGAG